MTSVSTLKNLFKDMKVCLITSAGGYHCEAMGAESATFYIEEVTCKDCLEAVKEIVDAQVSK